MLMDYHKITFCRRRYRKYPPEPITLQHGAHGVVWKDKQGGMNPSQDSGIVCETRRTQQWLLDQTACRYCKDNTDHSDNSDITEEREQQYYHKKFCRKF